MSIVPSDSERGIVVFRVWPSLDYTPRLALSFGLILLGLAVQFVTETFWVGAVLIFAGNLFLIVRGYDNRVDYGTLEHDVHWERVEVDRLDSIKDLDRRMRHWDSSALDITNPMGAVIGIAIFAALAIGAIATEGFARFLLVDALILLVPHWLTGVRSILRKPKLLVRVDTIQAVLDGAAADLEPHEVSLMVLLRGSADAEATQLPEDVKFKVDPAGHHPDFLGLYGQVVINDVQGSSHPYFYVVLVAKDPYGLAAAARRFQPPENTIVEIKRQDHVEVLVIRQRTTKTSGYETKDDVATAILASGLTLAEQVAVGPVTAS